MEAPINCILGQSRGKLQVSCSDTWCICWRPNFSAYNKILVSGYYLGSSRGLFSFHCLWSCSCEDFRFKMYDVTVVMDCAMLRSHYKNLPNVTVTVLGQMGWLSDLRRWYWISAAIREILRLWVRVHAWAGYWAIISGLGGYTRRPLSMRGIVCCFIPRSMVLA